MSEDFDNDTTDWCDQHAVPRRDCHCELPETTSISKSGRQVVRVGADKVVMKRPRWLIGQMIPLRAFTLLAGREGLGKSTLWAMWAAAVTNGTTGSPDIDGPAGVLIIANEDDLGSTIKPRLVAAGADIDRVDFIVAQTEIGFTESVTIPLDTSQLIKQALEAEARLIIMDPLVSVLDGSLDSHKDHSIRKALGPIGQIAEQSGVAVVGLVHLNKGQGTNVLDRVLGSRAFTAAARSVIVLVEDGEDDHDTRRLVVHGKSNLGPREQQAQIVEISSVEVPTQDGPASVSRIDVVGLRDVGDISDLMAQRDPDDFDNLNEAGQWLIEYLTKAPGRKAFRQEIMEAGKKAGYSTDQIRRAQKKAGVISTPANEPQPRAIWSLPE